MLRSMNDLEDYAVLATDGKIGQVKDFYFDDETWVIRYLVVDTGNWLLSRNVLISPKAVTQANWSEKILPVALTQEQVKNSPNIDTEQPVSRQHEMRHLGYYGYPYYWGQAFYPNLGLMGVALPTNTDSQFHPTEAELHQNDDFHLRSCKAVVNYHIVATDGDIGHVSGMLVDEKTWAVRYLIVDTSNWWLDHQVLVAPELITNVNWHKATVSVNLTQQAVQDAPPYDPSMPMSHAHQIEIDQHYEKLGYLPT